MSRQTKKRASKEKNTVTPKDLKKENERHNKVKRRGKDAKPKDRTKLNSSQKAIYTFLGICMVLFAGLLAGLFKIYSNLFSANLVLLQNITEEAATDSLLKNLLSQQSITLTITGVVAAFLGLLLSGLTILRELKLDKNTNEVEALKIETRKLIIELKTTYDMLIIKNSFSNVEKGAFSNTKRTMLLQMQGHLENVECNNELFDHHLLDELYSYTSYKFGYPTHEEAKEAYKKVESIGSRLLNKIGTSLDYSSCCKRYITHLKCAEAGYNLLTNCADNDVAGVDKPAIYHTVTEHYKAAQNEDSFDSDLDGFIECRLGLLKNWNEKYHWEWQFVPQKAKEIARNELISAKNKLSHAIKKNNCEIWYYSLGATCIRLSAYENGNNREKLLTEAENYCKKSLLINAEAINAYVNLANIQVYRINNLLDEKIANFRKGAFTVDANKTGEYSEYCEKGLGYCQNALRVDANSIGALRKKATFLCLKTKTSSIPSDIVNFFKEAIESIKKAEEVEAVCTNDEIPSDTIVSEKKAMKEYINQCNLIDTESKKSLIKLL